MKNRPKAERSGWHAAGESDYRERPTRSECYGISGTPYLIQFNGQTDWIEVFPDIREFFIRRDTSGPSVFFF